MTWVARLNGRYHPPASRTRADRPPTSRSFGRFERRIIDRSAKTPAAPQIRISPSTGVVKPNRSVKSSEWRSPEAGWGKFARDLYGAVSVKRLFWVCCQFFVRSGKAVLRPVACDQVPGARGRGQGTETLAELGGLPPSVALVSQRLEA